MPSILPLLQRHRSIAILVLAALPVLAAASPRIEHWTTPEGARVLFVSTHALPIVDIQLTFAAGSARDGDLPGIGRLLSNLLDDGAGELDADAIARRFEDLGARFSSESHTDMGIVGLRSLSTPELFAPALETLVTIVQAPAFPEPAIERERRQQLIAIQAEKESPGAIARRAFMAAVYRDHPYGRSPLGDQASLSRIDHEALLEHYRRYYAAGNAVIAIVGDLDTDRARRVAGRIAEALPKGPAAPALPPVPPLDTTRTIAIDFPSTQTHLLIGQPGMRRNDPDYFPLYVGNHILGGSGLVSRISEEIRERNGLAYSAYSYFSPMQAEGPFTVGLQTRNEQADRAERLVMRLLRDFIENGPTPAELESSKKAITGGFPLRLSSNGKIVSNLAMIGFYRLPFDYLDSFNQQVEAVTLDQIKAAFRRRIDPDRLVIVRVGRQDDGANEP